nr:FAD:protein FMN transferase [uncultured Cellulosilyticum sp.]
MNNSTSNKTIFSLLTLFISVIFFTACGQTQVTTEPLRRTEFMLGTTVSISLYDHQSEQILDKAFNRIAQLEDTLSINKTGTLLDKVNQEAGKSPVQVDADTLDVIQKGLTYSALTEGSFDITVGPIVKLWNIGFPEARVPSKEEIIEKLPLIDYQKVILDEAAQTVFLESPGMLIDLGGIGKGYAADEVATLLRAEGVEHAIIDLGGNLYMLGNKPGNKPWTVGIQDPFNPRGNIIGRIQVENKSIVTSGIYERFIEQDGIKYHHILNPKTGYPYTNEIAGVTIISDYSIDGDAISTAVFSKGVGDGLQFIESLDGVDAIFVTTDYKIFLSSGVLDNFVLTNPNFTISSLN